MNATQSFLKFFQANGNVLTLGEIAKTTHVIEYRKSISLLRKEGWTITCDQNYQEPSKNVYRLSRMAPVKVEWESDGQACLVMG